tara:strand:- start:1258 stop:1902 length:645 start_codon:yes stop_codon:yes gene_type:complete
MLQSIDLPMEWVGPLWVKKYKLNKEIKKLNLGSGKFPKKGYINLDMDKNINADIVHNLDDYPWPLPDNHFEIIEMDHILEHISDIRQTLKEIDRILINGGQVIIKVPHFSRGFTHWDHKHGFDVSFPLYFKKEISGGFKNLSLKHIKTKLIWFGQLDYKKFHLNRPSYYAGKFLGYIFDFLGNLNHYFTSKILCYWVGGYDEIKFIFQKSTEKQ